MPGARLTGRERERIAAGLRSREGYAAIARDIGRPTSTVSREVARNGGRAGYAPDRAQQETRRRARRGRNDPHRAAHATPRTAPAGTETDEGRVREFAEDFAGVIMLSGTPRMPARVLAHLLVTDAGALNAHELCVRLAVSPGAVSKAVRFLEAFSLVRRERLPGQRRELYRFSGDWAETFARREELFSPWEDGARRGAHLLGPGTPAGARMAELAHFMRVVRGTIVQVGERWRRARHHKAPQG